MKKRSDSAKEIAKRELKKGVRENKIHNLVLYIFLAALAALIIIAGITIADLTGFFSLSSQGGYVSEISLHQKFPTETWSGAMGLALRVPGFGSTIFEDIGAGNIERVDVFFDCIQADATGGPEIYASTNPSLVISDATTTPYSPAVIDQTVGCSNKPYCAVNTYTKNMTVYIGETPITNVPSTHTFKYDGQNEVFDVGILNISGELVYVAHVNATVQRGFSFNQTVNYQMLLAAVNNTVSTYYFYTDPNDVCPSGGIGNSINSTVSGYTIDNTGSPLANTTVTFAGESTTSDENGFYNVSALVLEGTYILIGQKNGYVPGFNNVTVTFSNFTHTKNITLTPEAPSGSANVTATLRIYGVVTDTDGIALDNATIYVGNATTQSNATGHYSTSATAVIGDVPIVAIKSSYDNYYAILAFNNSVTEIEHNITMAIANLQEHEFETGPAAEDNADEDPGDSFAVAQQQAEELGQDFWVSPNEINKQVRENTFIEDKISVYNFKSTAMRVNFEVSQELQEILKLDAETLSISTNSFESTGVTISGIKPIGMYRGTITLSGDIEQEIPVVIEIVPRKFNIESLIMEIDLTDSRVAPGSDLKYRLKLENLLTEQGYKINLKHLVVNQNNTIVYVEEDEEVEIKTTLSLIKSLQIPEDLPEGEYLLRIEANYLNLFSSVTSPFRVALPLYLYSFFGIPLWIIFVLVSALSFVTLNVMLYRRHMQKKKRFHIALRTDLLPKPGPRSIKIGKLAERKEDAYYNIDDLTTHGIVAGATGGGKSIAAQVFVEEMLMKGIAVIVFDPTAQWSGMLRKGDDKKMMAFYPKFGLKPSDSRAFPGNVRQITNELESIKVDKYASPGQIQVFTMNKLDPSQIDTFVAGAINNVFKSDPKESPQLKTLLVFDEVHRLLPKFGGSGKGFLQIERACREFRKWGIGVLLVSQVLSDFVGEIKANINTEVQMRVAEENDLERIKERYGLDALKSLVRAGVGTGMIQNAEYNKGIPYFVSLRPILHSTRRLTDDILEKYNQYNETIMDIEYEIEQLESEKVDTFDLKMELKLVKDKLMTGNFTVVDIYLEGLKPRLEKQWESIGKKPKKREIELIDPKELESALLKAKAEHDKANAKSQSSEEEKKEVKVDPATKIVAPITFDNGMMVSSLNELKDVLPGLDDSVFATHVNEEKNEIADWIAKQVDPALGEKVKPLKDKAAIVQAINEFGKAPAKPAAAQPAAAKPTDKAAPPAKTDAQSQTTPAKPAAAKPEPPQKPVATKPSPQNAQQPPQAKPAQQQAAQAQVKSAAPPQKQPAPKPADKKEVKK